MRNRQITVALLIIITISVFLSSCRTRKEYVPEIEKGILIGEVRWAAYNVDLPGMFVSNPEDAGMFFQWNRMTAWSTTDDETEAWDYSTPIGNTWEAYNNPCPTGWRLPTGDELEALQKAGSEWTNRNGVYGRLFGTAPYQIFLPAVGWRCGNDGLHDYAMTKGYYWSSTASDDESAIYLWFNAEEAGVDWDWRADGFNVRCVVE